MKKEYLAVMKGIVEKDEFTITCPIGKVKYLHCKLTQFLWSACPPNSSNDKQIDESGKPSISHFKVLKRVPAKNVTVVCTEL